MPDHSIDAAMSLAADRSRASRSRRPRRTDWRLGGRTVHRWRADLLVIALVCLGVALIAGSLVARTWPQYGWVGNIIIWLGFAVPAVIAFRRSVPAGLLRFKPVDLLYGIAFGVALRLLQGALSDSAWPSVATLDGQLPASWWFWGAIAPVLISPLLEEFFFRAVITVSVFTLLRRAAGAPAATFAALVVSIVCFVAAHLVAGSSAPEPSVELAMVAAVCAALVMTTGRIWAAVTVHMTFNLTGVAVLLVSNAWSQMTLAT